MSARVETEPRPNSPLSALVTVRWGDTVVATRHLEGRAEALVGAALETLAPIPCEPAGAAAIVVARVHDGAAVAFVPRGAVGFRERPRAIPSPVAGPSEITLAASDTVSFSIGQFLVTVTAEEASKAPWTALSPLRASFGHARYFAAAALAHALLIGLSAQAAYASSIVESAPDHEDLRRYLAAAEDRSAAQETIVTSDGLASLGRDVNQHDGNGKDGGGTRAAGREGSMGAAASRSTENGRFGLTGSSRRDGTYPPNTNTNAITNTDVRDREQAIADAREFGMAGVLAADRPRIPVSSFASEATNSPDPFDATGAMWATAVGETFGAGGLGMSGVGEGGGGKGEGSIGLGEIGTIGHTFGRPGSGTGGGGGPLMGFGVAGWGSWGGPWHSTGIGIRLGTIGVIGHGGADVYDLNPGHRDRPDRAREEQESRLPPETIRRIVRQSHGTFRACYQSALLSNPGLAGGVTTRFLIGADGHVKSASNLGADLPDKAVIACITRAFYGLVFPEPPGGRPVTVTYPLTFSPSR